MGDLSRAAAELGRRRWVGVGAADRHALCSAAGLSSANALTPEQRSARARRASIARWEREKKRAQ